MSSHFHRVAMAMAGHPGSAREALADASEANRPTDPPGPVHPFVAQHARPAPRTWDETDLSDIDKPGANLGGIVERVTAKLAELCPDGGYEVRIKPVDDEDFVIMAEIGGEGVAWRIRNLVKSTDPYGQVVRDLDWISAELRREAAEGAR